MSTLLEQASLVMIPSGYKEDVVYSQIPTDGSGDLSFTRASNGTRVNSAGLVEVCPWNLLQYSEDFSSLDWNKSNLTITADSTTAPNGTTTADKAIPNTTNGGHGLENAGYLNLTIGQTYTVSFYAKASGYNFIQFLADGGDISGNPRANFNLSNGTLGSVDTELTASIESVGNGWYRCVISFVVAYNVFNLGLYVSDSGTATRPPIFTGNGTDGVFIWGAQLNEGSTAKPYFPTTDRLNVPRLTYQNGGGGCPSLLLEKQSTNLVTYSQDFTQWTIIRASLGANTTAPNGVNDGYSIIANTTNDDHFVLQDVSVVNATVYSYNAFLKKGNKSWARLWNTSVGYADFDLENGVVGTQSSAVGSIQSFGNGWYRCSIVYTANSTGNNSHRIYTLNGDNSRIFAGDGSTINLYMFGAQLEASSYPTSYIPTTSSSATRVADACFKTGISSLIGQTEGVVFVDAKNLYPSGTRTIGLLFTSGSAYYQMYINSSNEVRVDVNGSFLFLGGTIAQNTQYKIAFAYKSGSNALYINGTQIATSASTTIPSSLTDFYVGNSLSTEQSGSINQAILFPTRLTNAELASLTTI